MKKKSNISTAFQNILNEIFMPMMHVEVGSVMRETRMPEEDRWQFESWLEEAFKRAVIRFNRMVACREKKYIRKIKKVVRDEKRRSPEAG
jgi:hypothetical protein